MAVERYRQRTAVGTIEYQPGSRRLSNVVRNGYVQSHGRRMSIVQERRAGGKSLGGYVDGAATARLDISSHHGIESAGGSIELNDIPVEQLQCLFRSRGRKVNYPAAVVLVQK